MSEYGNLRGIGTGVHLAFFVLTIKFALARVEMHL